MSTFTQSVREALLNPRRIPLLFLLGTYVTGIGVNDASSWLAERIKIPVGVLALVVFVLLAVVLQSDWFYRLWRPASPPAAIVPAGSCKGLVLFASLGPGIATVEAAIRWHAAGLEKVWLFHSAGSAEAARSLVTHLKALPELARIGFILHPLDDFGFDNPEEVRVAIEETVYRALPEGMVPEDVVIDITGGMKTTTSGAFLAGLPEGRRLQVNRPAKKDEAGRGLLPGSPYEIRIDYRVRRVRRRP